MKQVVLKVADHKLQTFLAFIEDLNYVELIEGSSEELTETLPAEVPSTDDFMALAGMWEGRDIDAEELRKKAWPTRE